MRRVLPALPLLLLTLLTLGIFAPSARASSIKQVTVARMLRESSLIFEGVVLRAWALLLGDTSTAQVGDNRLVASSASSNFRCRLLGLGLLLAVLFLQTNAWAGFPEDVEGFEAGPDGLVSSTGQWLNSGFSPGWQWTTSIKKGNYALISGGANHGQYSGVVFVGSVPHDGRVDFDFTTSSEFNYDFLQFYIDQTLVFERSGNFVDGFFGTTWFDTTSFSNSSMGLSAGDHVLEWRYVKDSVVSVGWDVAVIDNVRFTAFSPPDMDSDGISDEIDNCPLIANSNQSDLDGDSVGDLCDNCLTVSNAGSLRCDSDLDGYGNVCDGDFNNDNVSDGLDFVFPYFLTDFGSGTEANNPAGNLQGTNMNCDSVVDGVDFAIPFFLTQFASGIPGPSGLSCAGAVPCLAP